jgi:hypothetical protein
MGYPCYRTILCMGQRPKMGHPNLDLGDPPPHFSNCYAYAVPVTLLVLLVDNELEAA